MIDFSHPFRDLSGLPAIPNRFFKFSFSKLGGFNLFSVKSKVQNPIITDFTAINDIDGSDFLKLKFNGPMDVIGRKANTALLADPRVSDTTIENTLESLSNTNSTLLGYHNETSKKFIPVYQLAIIKPNEKTTSAPLYIANGKGASAPNLVKSAIVDSKNLDTIIIELPKEAFEKNDMIILSAGAQLEGLYIGDKEKNLGAMDFKTDILVPSKTEFEKITDPSGNIMIKDNLVILNGIYVNTYQKVSIAD